VANVKEYDQCNQAERSYALIKDQTEGTKIWMLDYLTRNEDRHRRNFMLGEGHVHAIDNGLGILGTDSKPGRSRQDFIDFTAPVNKSVVLADGSTHHRYILPTSFKTRLETVLKDGSLQKIVDTVASRSKGQGQNSPKEMSDAVITRGNWMVAHWEDYFHD
jgi:hypothetical protein